MIIPDKVYDVLKWVALVVLPGLGSLYAALASMWGWPYIEEIPGTLQAVCFFIGALIGVSTAGYNKKPEEQE